MPPATQPQPPLQRMARVLLVQFPRTARPFPALRPCIHAALHASMHPPAPPADADLESAYELELVEGSRGTEALRQAARVRGWWRWPQQAARRPPGGRLCPYLCPPPPPAPPRRRSCGCPSPTRRTPWASSRPPATCCSCARFPSWRSWQTWRCGGSPGDGGCPAAQPRKRPLCAAGCRVHRPTAALRPRPQGLPGRLDPGARSHGDGGPGHGRVLPGSRRFALLECRLRLLLARIRCSLHGPHRAQLPHALPAATGGQHGAPRRAGGRAPGPQPTAAACSAARPQRSCSAPAGPNSFPLVFPPATTPASSTWWTECAPPSCLLCSPT